MMRESDCCQMPSRTMELDIEQGNKLHVSLLMIERYSSALVPIYELC